MPIDYSQTKIYKLVENGDLDHPIYVGHTTEKYLSNRMNGHRKAFRQWKKDKKNKTAWFRDDIQLKNIDIKLIEDYPCENIGQARGRELEWKQYYQTKQNNPQPIFLGEGVHDQKEWRKQYKEINREFLKDKNKIYRENNKEKITKYFQVHKDEILKQKKKYYTLNKDKILNKMKINKEKIKSQQQQKKTCSFCGNEITHHNMSRHIKLFCKQNSNKNNQLNTNINESAISEIIE